MFNNKLDRNGFEWNFKVRVVGSQKLGTIKFCGNNHKKDQFQAQFQQMNAMAPMAMNMGQQFLGQQADMLKAKADEYIPTTKLRYLFAVDNSYVFHKLKIIAFPWMNSDWALKYQSDANNPVAPR